MFAMTLAAGAKEVAMIREHFLDGKDTSHLLD